MADRGSALAHLSHPVAANPQVTLSEIRCGSILQVGAWPDTSQIVEAAIADLLGVQIPRLGHAYSDPNATLAAIGPGRFLIAGAAPDLAPRFEAALPSADGSVTDLSHGRAVLRLEGSATAALLAKGVALDLHPSAFPPGRAAQTMIHHIDVLLHRRAEAQFHLWALRGFAEALAEWLLDAGLEFGIAWPNGHP